MCMGKPESQMIAASVIFSSIRNLFSSLTDMDLPTFLDTLILQPSTSSI